MTNESLWPARNVAEYAYCPRLFYLMEVEGVFLASADTEKGLAAHRRVDRPSPAPEDEDEEPDSKKTKSVRKLPPTSPTLGLTATLDLTEIVGKTAVPIEYRKRRPKRISPAPPPDDPGEVDDPPQPEEVVDALAHDAGQTRNAMSLDTIRGHEGQAAAIYFKHFSGMFRGTLAAEFDARGRQRRPPPDPVNAGISSAYSMLTHECVAALRSARLEPSIGADHVSRPGRPALALDLMEPFRPLSADSIAVSAFNRGELTEGHFMRTAAGCALTDAGRKAFCNAYGPRMDVEVTHPVFEYRLSYRRMRVLHARMIAAWLLGEVPTLAFLTTR